MATPRPAHCSISMSLRPSPMASTSAASTPSSLGDVRQARRPWRPRPARGRARPSSRRRSRCRAGRASAASATKSSAVASGSRMITRLTGPATRSSTSVMIISPESSPVGERPVDAVADAALLDRDQRRRVVLEHRRDRRRARRRSPRGRPRAAGSGRPRRRCWPPPRAARRRRRAGRAGRRRGSCRAGSGRWPARRGRRRRAARCTASYTAGADLLVRRAGALDPLQQRAVDVERDQPRPPVASAQVGHSRRPA